MQLPKWTLKQAQTIIDYQEKDFKTMILSGAVRSGKTVVNNYIFLSEIMAVRARATERGVKTPIYILGGVSSKTITNNIIIPLQNTVPSLTMKWDRNGAFTLFGVKVVLAYTGNIGGLSAIRGLEAWGAYINEASLANEEVFKEITTRLSAPKARLIADTNPDNPNHWLKVDYIDQASIPEKRILVRNFTIDDNEFLDPEYVETLKAQFSGVFYDRAIRGLWVLSDGVIYSNFDREKMVVDLPEDTPFGREWVSIDYGTLNATVFKRWSFFDGTWYNTDEYYYSGRDKKKQKTDEEYADDLEEFYKRNKMSKSSVRVILDPSAASFRTSLKKRKFNVKSAKNDVVNGIRTQMSLMNDGRIKWTSKAKYTFKELSLYIWNKKASEHGKDEPVKEHDHCMDADRYFCYTVLGKKDKNNLGGTIGWS